MNKQIYMDYASTTYIRKEVLNEMMPFLNEYFGNPSGIHQFSRISKNAIEKARELVSKSLKCNKKEIFFTSGGTESNNWALKGVAFRNRRKGNHIITSKIEHHSILNTCKYLETQGFKVTYLDVCRDGLINIDDFRNSITSKTIVSSIAFVNNEIGTVQNIELISNICQDNNVVFHTDAIQAVGKLDISLDYYKNISLLSISGHKIYGPKGIGILYIKEGTEIDNYIHGGSQEKGRRSGTENVSGIVGISKAVELSCTELYKNKERIQTLRDYMIKCILEKIPNSKLNGSIENRSINNINICFDMVGDEGILLALDLEGVLASSGSSCNSGSVNTSHVLQAIGLTPDEAKGSVRFTIGIDTTEAEINYVVDKLKDIVQRYRNL